MVSRPYVEITIDVMEQFGVKVVNERSRFKVVSGQRYRPREFAIEEDVSSVSYFWAAAAVTRGTVVIGNINPFILQFWELWNRL